MKKYIGLSILFAFMYVLGSSIYDYVNKSSKIDRIRCQQETTSFERVYIKKDINIAQEHIRSANVEFSSSVQKAKYSKSKLFDFVKLTGMDEVLKKILDSYVLEAKDKEEKVKIEYYIYENDINDPGKKTKKSKLYAGYVVFRFYNPKHELIYQVQIDFMDQKGADIPKKIECAIKSFITLKV